LYDRAFAQSDACRRQYDEAGQYQQHRAQRGRSGRRHGWVHNPSIVMGFVGQENSRIEPPSTAQLGGAVGR
jgi:hypothetical protein